MSDIYIPRSGAQFRFVNEGGFPDAEKEKEARTNLANVCVKIPYKDYEISIACDDSAGVCTDLARSDLRVFRGDVDLTLPLMKSNAVRADAEAIRRAMAAIDEIKP